MVEAPSPKKIVAVIDIGTSAIRMIVAEIGQKSQMRYLENLQKPIQFGQDVFTKNRISSTGMRAAIDILKNFKTVIDGYGVDKIQAVATSAVREAENRDNFIDQVYIRTGIDVEILEGPEENRLELIAVEHALGDKIDLNNKNCLIVEVGSGSTEMIILNHGRVEITQTLTVGSMRLPENIVLAKTDPATLRRILKRRVHEVAAYAAKESYNMEQLDTFIALGSDMRLTAYTLQEESKNQPFTVMNRKEFSNFMNSVSKTTPDDLAVQLGISYTQAERFIPSLLIYSNFMAETKAEEIIIPMVSIRDGLLLELSQMLSGYKRTDVSKQVLNSAKHLAEKYEYNETQSLRVAALALKLFDSLVKDHGMGSRERLLLEVSAILHGIGIYISPSGYHKHSMYLVNASDIFGLRKADKNIVANVVRYHRRSIPKPTHTWYMSLPKVDRAIVTKLTAILRVAFSLDESAQQKIKNFDLEVANDSYTIWVPAEVGDISVERSAIREKGDLFADVFGAPIQLKQRRSTEG